MSIKETLKEKSSNNFFPRTIRKILLFVVDDKPYPRTRNIVKVG